MDLIFYEEIDGSFLRVCKDELIMLKCRYCQKEIGKFKVSMDFRWDRDFLHSYGKRMFKIYFDIYYDPFVAIPMHHACRKGYFTNYWKGIKWKNQPCEICNEDLVLSKIYIKDFEKGIIRHKECDERICDHCLKPIGTANSTWLRNYLLHEKCKSILVISDLIKAPFPPEIGSLSNNTRIKIYTFDFDVFWEKECTRENFIRLPREFQAMGREFLMVLLVLRKIPLRNFKMSTDIVLKILTYAIQPRYYPVQNGFSVDSVFMWTSQCQILKRDCARCGRHYALTNIDIDQGACIYNKCSIYKYICPKGHKVLYSDKSIDNDNEVCTDYRCINDRCSLCEGPIRPHDDENTYDMEYCKHGRCAIFSKDPCHCGNKCTHPFIEIPLSDMYCQPDKCLYIVEKDECVCGDDIYINLPKGQRCTLGRCKYQDDPETQLNVLRVNQLKQKIRKKFCRVYGL